MTHANQVWPSHDEDAPFRVLPKATVPAGKAADHENGLQVRLPADTLATNHGGEVVHLHRGGFAHGVTNDVRGVAEPVTMERRVGGDS